MKTPKRIIPCPKCGAPCELGISVIESWDERFEVPAFFCTRSGEGVEINISPTRMNAIYARWKRKNREARLRHKIDLLSKELERQKQIAKRQHQIDSESYEEIHQKWYELKRKYQELKKQKKGE